MGSGGILKMPHFWLRLLLMVSAIVAFACVAQWAGDKVQTIQALDKVVRKAAYDVVMALDDNQFKILFQQDEKCKNCSTGTFQLFGFTVFIGVASTVLCLVLMCLYFKDVDFARGTVIMILDIIWAIVWIICAGLVSWCLATVNGDWTVVAVGGEKMPSNFKTNLTASVVFSWFAAVLHIAASVLGCTDRKRSRAHFMSDPPAVSMAGGPVPGAPAPSVNKV